MQLRCISEGSKSESAVVLCGPMASTGAFWRPLVPALAGRATVYVAEYPGCKGGPELAASSVAELGALLAGELERLGLDDLHLVGHSFGGWVAQQAALVARARLRSLALMGSSLRIYQLGISLFGSWLELFDQLGPELVLTQMACWSLSPLTLEKNPELVRLFVESSLRAFQTPATLRAQLEAAIAYASPPNLGLLTMPALLLRGAYDAMAPAPCIDELRGALVNARAAEVPNAGHALLIEEPLATSALLLGFWKEVESATARSG